MANGEIYCVGCNRFLKQTEFWYNYNDFYKKTRNNRMLYCKDCCKSISQQIMSKYWTDKNFDDFFSYELGIREICSFFDMPYTDEAMQSVRDIEFANGKKKDWSYVRQYGVALKDNPDYYWNNLSGNNFLADDILKIAKHNSDGDNELWYKLNKEWGKQNTLEDYVFLEERFFKYTDGEILTPYIESTIRRLCLAELDYKKLKADKNTEQIDLKRIEDKISAYGKTLKIDKFDSTKNKTLGESILEKWTSIEEQKRPLELVEDKEFADDICGIRKITDEIYRSLKNVLSGSKDYPEL